MESFSFKETEYCDRYISAFLRLIDEPSSQEQVLGDVEKITKLLRTLPTSYDVLAMACSLTSPSFYENSNTDSANIERRKKKAGAWNRANISAHAFHQRLQRL